MQAKTSSFLFSLLICASSFAAQPVIEYQYQVVERFQHDPDLFTQGLEYHHGILYESAGRYGQSRVITRTLDKLQPIQNHHLNKRFFAEGITLLNQQLYQLTWQSQQGFIYNPKTLKPSGQFTINGEGWGLTNNGKVLIVSNGSSQLQFIDPENFKLLRSITVRVENTAVNNINELEWIDGLIYANIWHSQWIIMIDPDNGQVVGKVFLKDLLPKNQRSQKTDALNGIAYDKENKRLLVTGKYWPTLFHISLSPKP
ncbi:MAG: glutaminyl-peptide cyclotransferase [Oceanicoccus sp.]|uniref:glutaminyl-peptide cyclotransferase n=1 Tax=Oceanicoccus sp. TaxID=2691044 RepID=UPI002606CD51|nr:glutaminyl-peptide cyclotransferase [Oceanicoccus sp.]MCP3907168.1 glutaminyl-peptide cyclotransferase [Oceanicoccus sp.]MDG1771947.1 glutaminyl-peptide cyclotransferase [Oceanicoccus sp.]